MSTINTAGRVTADTKDIVDALARHERPVGKTSLALSVVFVTKGTEVRQGVGESIGKALRRSLNVAQFERDLQDLVAIPNSPVITVTQEQYRYVTGRQFETAKVLYILRERWAELLQRKQAAEEQSRLHRLHEKANQIVLARHESEVQDVLLALLRGEDVTS